LMLSAGTVRAAVAADATEARKELLAGNYKDVVDRLQPIVRDGASDEWVTILVRALLATGRNAEADTIMTDALRRDPSSIVLRWLSRDVAYANDRPTQAAARASEIYELFKNRQWMYREPADTVVFGRTALAIGADPKDVLDRVYSVAQRADPKLRDVYLARGDLALDKCPTTPTCILAGRGPMRVASARRPRNRLKRR